MQPINASAIANVLRLALNPALCLPHLTVPTFDKLDVPLKIQNRNIRGVVVDKDNCFAKDHDDKVWPAYLAKWEELKSEYADRLLIVSNSAGTDDDDGHAQALALERNTGVPVLRHLTKKPGCHGEIETYFKEKGIAADELVVIGDRLFTDVLMANMMGALGIWISEGVELSQKLFPRLERGLYAKLKS